MTIKFIITHIQLNSICDIWLSWWCDKRSSGVGKCHQTCRAKATTSIHITFTNTEEGIGEGALHTVVRHTKSASPSPLDGFALISSLTKLLLLQMAKWLANDSVADCCRIFLVDSCAVSVYSLPYWIWLINSLEMMYKINIKSRMWTRWARLN